MSLDLFQPEIQNRLASMPLTTQPEPSMWDGFLRGAGLSTMRGLARVGRTIDLLGSVGPIATDAITGGTEAQDRYFREHDDVWGSAVKHWTPEPGEVGLAGQVVGNLAAMLPMVMASPALAIADAQVGTAQDLVDEGVSSSKAQAVGAAQAVGLGLGIWMPILGQNLWQRILVGGAGFNAVQGMVTRAASSEILKGTAAATAFEPFDTTQITLDVLLGAAFGTMAHLSPDMRAQGAATWQRIADWAQNLSPGDKAAIAALRQAQHANVDTFPGDKPAGPEDVSAHKARLDTALEQILREQPVNVENLPEPKAEGDMAPRLAEAEARIQELSRAAEQLRAEEGIAPVPAEQVPPTVHAMQARDVATDIREKLVRAGVPEAEATANSTLWEAFFKTTAKRMGMTPEDLYARYPVDVTTRAPEGADVLGQRQASGYAGSHEPGKTSEAAAQPENLPATVGGGRPAQGWTGATRASRAGRPIPLYRGAAGALEPGHFDAGSLGHASGNPSAGLGVWFTPDKAEAGTYGPHVDEAYVDVRKPKVIKVEDLPGFETAAEATAYREQLRAEGYDSIVVTAKHLGGKSHIIVFDPQQVIPATAPEQGVLYQSARRGERFYSELARQVDTVKMNQAPAQGWKDWLKSLAQKGVKADEVKWSGIEEWLDMQEGRVTKAQVQEFLKNNGVRIEEVMLGGPKERTLADQEIAPFVQILADAGYHPEVNPEDTSMIAFMDEAEGDLITSSEFENTTTRQAAQRIEQYWWGRPNAERGIEDGHIAAQVELMRDHGFRPEILADGRVGFYDEYGEQTVSAAEIESFLPDRTPEEQAALRPVIEAAYRIEQYMTNGETRTPSAEDRDSALEVLENTGWTARWQEQRFEIGRIGPDGVTVEMWMTIPNDAQRVAEIPAGEAGSIPGFDPIVLEAATELQAMGSPAAPPVMPTKFGQFQLGGPKTGYRELLLRLGENFDRLPRGYKIAETAPGTAWKYVLEDPSGTGTRLFADTPEEAFRAAMQQLDKDGVLDKQAFRESHWDQSNVLAHVRFNERTDADGKKVLFVEEIQSDWAQRGKRKGFDDPQELKASRARFNQAGALRRSLEPAAFAAMDKYIAGDTRDSPRYRAFSVVEDKIKAGQPWRIEYGVFDEADAKAIEEYVRAQIKQDAAQLQVDALLLAAVPAAPFVGKTDAWVGLVLKRMIAYAAEKGFDRIAWTTGEQQTERWSGGLRKAVDRIEWTKTDKGIQIVGYKGRPGVGLNDRQADRMAELRRIAQRNQLTPEDQAEMRALDFIDRRGWDKRVDTTEREDVLSDAIGKTMAQRIIQDPSQSGVIEGDQIVVADTGMAEFYDRIVPKVAKDILKKLGGKGIGETTIETGTTAEKPSFTALPEGIQDQYAGAENFPNGGPPGYASAQVKIDGMGQRVDVVIDRNGIHMNVTDGEPTEFFAPWDDLVPSDKLPQNGIDAMGLVERQWTNQESVLWKKLQPIVGEAKSIAPTPSADKQMAFDITPEMRAKVSQGLQLFQSTEGTARGYLKGSAGERQGEAATIGLLEQRDKSTFLHESGHFFLDVTNDLARSPEAPDALRQDMNTLYQWMGVEGGADAWNAMSLEEKRPFHETFARGFEQYLREGEAPAPELRNIFQLFRDWLIEIYRSARDLNVTVSREVKEVFDRMLAEPKAEGPAARPVATEPPPPRGVRAAEAVGPEAADPWGQSLEEHLRRREAAAGTFKQLTLQDEPLRNELQHMADMETGWESIGGRLDRGRMAREQGVAPEDVSMGTPAFTPWIPKAEWWPNRPGPAKLGEKAVQEAVRKALAGEPLKKGEQRTIDYMMEVANHRLAAMDEIGGPEEWAGILSDLQGTELEPVTDNVVDANLVARAAAIDETRVENAAIRYENDDTAFMAEIKAILDEADQDNQAARSGQADSAAPEAGGQQPAEAAGERAAEAVDPLAAAAERFVAEQPSRLLQVGTNADGTPQYVSAQEFLQAARDEAAQAREDMKLFEVAAQCMLNGGRA